jgi:transposase
MGQLSFNGGKEWETFKKIQVIETKGTKKAFVRGHQYMSWKPQDQSAQRVAIAQLYECGIATQEELAEAFGISIKSVYNYITAFATGGIQDLIEQNSGPKQRWKLLPEVRAKILVTVLKEGIREYAAVQERLNNWNVNVSIESIRQVLLESGLVRESTNTWEGEQGDLFESSNNSSQLKIDFCDSEHNVKEESWPKPKKEDDASFYSKPVRKDRSFYSPAQRGYLDQLEQGMYSTYAGGLLFIPLLKQYNFLKTIKQVIDIEKHEGYSLDELCLALFYFDLFRFESMENFKTAYPEEFGILVGRVSSPSTFTLRRFLHKVRELGKSEMLTCEFAKEYLRKGLAKWGVLYIDGHFLPYYGIYPINMGWHGVRKIPMKGSYNFLAVDEKFNPWMFLVRSSSEDLLKKIPEIILKAKKKALEVGIAEEEVNELIVMFDREGYSAELFRILDGKDSENGGFKITFITWAKYADRWVYDEKDIKFDRTTTVTYEIQKPEKVKYFETERLLKKYGKIRTIVIGSGSDKRRAAIYTNNKKMDAERIIQLTCRRWGHENLIKELMLKHLINYSPGYEPEEIEEQPMIENPRVKKLKQERANLKL